jgi:predicted dehydrogenase
MSAESKGRPEPLSRRELLSHASLAAASAAVCGITQNARALGLKKSPIRIGQVGVAHGHATKISVYRQSPDYEVVGIVESDPELRRRAQSHPAFQGLPWLSLDQLLDIPGLQAVLVESSPRESLPLALSCVSAGKHVHLDKPAGESLPLFHQILSEARRQNLLVQMGYMYRYNPAFLLLQEFIRHRWLGEVFEIHAVMSKLVPPASRQELAEYPGGMMFELGCHLIDLIVTLMGEPAQVHPFQQQLSLHQDNLTDNSLAVLQYPQSMATVKSTGLEVEGFARRHLVVCGTEGTFHIQPLDDPSAKIALKRPTAQYSSGYQELSFPAYSRYTEDAAEMARILREEKSPEYSYDHDLIVQRTVLKASGLPID